MHINPVFTVLFRQRNTIKLPINSYTYTWLKLAKDINIS